MEIGQRPVWLPVFSAGNRPACPAHSCWRRRGEELSTLAKATGEAGWLARQAGRAMFAPRLIFRYLLSVSKTWWPESLVLQKSPPNLRTNQVRKHSHASTTSSDRWLRWKLIRTLALLNIRSYSADIPGIDSISNATCVTCPFELIIFPPSQQIPTDGKVKFAEGTFHTDW